MKLSPFLIFLFLVTVGCAKGKDTINGSNGGTLQKGTDPNVTIFSVPFQTDYKIGVMGVWQSNYFYQNEIRKTMRVQFVDGKVNLAVRCEYPNNIDVYSQSQAEAIYKHTGSHISINILQSIADTVTAKIDGVEYDCSTAIEKDVLQLPNDKSTINVSGLAFTKIAQ